MCLLFLYINPCVKHGEYKIVLANNRDETLSRPSAPAALLDNDPNIISPLDLDPRRKPGGTWIGVSKQGKLGILLNILTAQIDACASGRGHLVTEYLSSNLSGSHYVRKLQESSIIYNPFHFIAIDIPAATPSAELYYFTNVKNESSCGKLSNNSNGYYGFCNSDDKDRPWNKCRFGLTRFKSVLSQHADVRQEQALTDKLMEVLADPKPHPDENILRQAETWSREDDFYRYYSAVNVKAYEDDYGTRSHTVILIDSENRVKYVEKYVRSSSTPQSLQWDTKIHEFALYDVNKTTV